MSEPFDTAASSIIDPKGMWRPAVVTLCALSVGEMGCSLFRRESAPGRVQVGLASWYDLPGRSTASGERYDQTQLTAAHRSLPLGTRVLVTNLANGKSVRVRINDRGPFARGRVIDVSRAAAQVLGMIERGTTRVQIESLGEGPPGTVTDRARPKKSRRRGGRTRRAPQG